MNEVPYWSEGLHLGAVWPTKREREVCKGGGVQHANVLTASTAHKRNAKENAKESSGNGDGVGRRRNFCGRANFWASMELLPNRLQAIFTRVACLWSCVFWPSSACLAACCCCCCCCVVFLACVFHLFFLPCPVPFFFLSSSTFLASK